MNKFARMLEVQKHDPDKSHFWTYNILANVYSISDKQLLVKSRHVKSCFWTYNILANVYSISVKQLLVKSRHDKSCFWTCNILANVYSCTIWLYCSTWPEIGLHLNLIICVLVKKPVFTT